MKAAQSLKELFFPPRCVFCDGVISAKEKPACPACIEHELPRIIENICPHCGREKERFCTCRQGGFLTDGMAAPFYYEGAVKQGIYCMKRVEDVDRTGYFVREMMEAAYRSFGDNEIDYVTGIPVSRRALSERGFNQSETLAKGLAKALHVPYEPMLRKCLDTPSQKEALTAEQRRVNLLGAFEVTTRLPLQGSRILMVDDVVTTGSTGNECAKMLKLSGAKSVYMLAAALTRMEKEEHKTGNGESR